MMICGVYAIIHQPSGRAYVGSSHDVFRRWRGHVGRLNSGRHINAALLDLWLMGGPGAFVFVVLEQCGSDALAHREQHWIDSFEHLLNGSRRAVGPSLDPIVAKKISVIRKQQGILPETRAKGIAALLGRPMPQEQTEKISRALQGRKKSPEHLEHLRLRLNDPDVREKRRAAARGKGHDAAWRAKVSASKMGHAVSEETRAKMRTGMLARCADPEFRAKISAASRAGWASKPMSRARMSEATRAYWQRMGPEAARARARNAGMARWAKERAS